MIARRMIPCERCGKPVAVRSKGLCPACRRMELREAGSQRERKPIKATRKAKDTDLSWFYGRHIQRLREIGMSLTGRRIINPTVSNICHLYPKRRYVSVAMDDRNVVYLTAGEHTRLDYLLDTMDFDRLSAEFGKAWDIMSGMMVSLAPEVIENGKLKRELLTWTNERKRNY